MTFKSAKIIARNANPADYLKEPCKRGEKGFTCSSSMLKLFAHCPSRWLAGYESPDSEAKSFGSLLDCRLLQPESFQARFAVTPSVYVTTGMVCPNCKSVTDSKKCKKCGLDRQEQSLEKPWNGNARECQEWLAEHDGLEIVSKQDVEDVDAAIKRLNDDDTIRAFLQASDVQVWVSGIWQDEKTELEIPVRALLDCVPRLDTEFAKSLADLKAIRSGAISPFTKQVYQYGWHIQAALHSDLYTAATGEDRTNWCFLGVENYAPFEPFRRLLSEDYIQIGRQTCQDALRRYAQCLTSGVWPGYDDHRDAIQGWSLVAPLPYMEYESLSAAMSDQQEAELEETADVPMP